jgi:hypothetical protein
MSVACCGRRACVSALAVRQLYRVLYIVIIGQGEPQAINGVDEGDGMYDSTMHVKTISRYFKSSDFIADKSLLDPTNSKIVVDQAVALGCSGFTSLSLKKVSSGERMYIRSLTLPRT